MFQKTSLMRLGLVVQLNHRRGPCPNPLPPVLFTVYDINGVQSVHVQYCGCDQFASRSGNARLDQIFAQQWFPATWKQPRTVFTFAVLHFFHVLNLQSKCNMFDFYRTILRIQNNAGLDHQPVSDMLNESVHHITKYTLQNHYNEFSFVVRLWRHLKLLKRAGRVQDPHGVMNMGPGALVPECPACPIPGCNLPPDWREGAPSDQYVYLYILTSNYLTICRWLYEKICAVDACFKLSLKNDPNSAKRSANDPELQSGHGVYVEDEAYQNFLAQHPHKQEVRLNMHEPVPSSRKLMKHRRTFQPAEPVSTRLKKRRDAQPVLDGV
jgi:hypothetical protein